MRNRFRMILRQRPFGDYYWVDTDIYRDDVRPVDYWDKKR